MSQKPACKCYIDGFTVNIECDNFVDGDETDNALPSYLLGTDYICISIENNGSNPFFSHSYIWSLAIIGVSTDESHQLKVCGGITFVPIDRNVSDIDALEIKEDGPDAVMDIYLLGDPVDDPDTRILLTNQGST